MQGGLCLEEGDRKPLPGLQLGNHCMPVIWALWRGWALWSPASWGCGLGSCGVAWWLLGCMTGGSCPQGLDVL